MSVNVKSRFETFLHRHDDLTWSRAIADLLPAIHEVDRTATLIWFKFFPLALWRVIEHSEDAEQLAKRLLLEGNYLLRNQIDSSHRFLYGHRYWPEVKKAVVEIAESEKNLTSTSLVVQTRDVAGRIAARSKVDDSLLVGITAIAFMALQQVGLPAFKASPGTVHLNREIAKKSPARVLRERARDDSQGILGFLKTGNKTWTITFNEGDPGARFKIVHEQEIASGAATDKRDWTSVDPRCTRGKAPSLYSVVRPPAELVGSGCWAEPKNSSRSRRVKRARLKSSAISIQMSRSQSSDLHARRRAAAQSPSSSHRGAASSANFFTRSTTKASKQKSCYRSSASSDRFCWSIFNHPICRISKQLPSFLRRLHFSKANLEDHLPMLSSGFSTTTSASQ